MMKNYGPEQYVGIIFAIFACISLGYITNYLILKHSVFNRCKVTEITEYVDENQVTHRSIITYYRSSNESPSTR